MSQDNDYGHDVIPPPSSQVPIIYSFLLKKDSNNSNVVKKLSETRRWARVKCNNCRNDF